jgi:hypothetical protein
MAGCAAQEALASYGRCMDLAPAGGARNAEQNRLLALNYIHGGEDPLVCAAHAEWGAAFAQLFQPLPPLPPAQPASGSSGSDAAGWSSEHGWGEEEEAGGALGEGARLNRPLVVGYVSPDLFTHSVSYFAEAPLAHHDPRRRAPHALRMHASPLLCPLPPCTPLRPGLHACCSLGDADTALFSSSASQGMHVLGAERLLCYW